MTVCRVCKTDITDSNEFWHHSKGEKDDYFCATNCVLEYIKRRRKV